MTLIEPAKSYEVQGTLLLDDANIQVMLIGKQTKLLPDVDDDPAQSSSRQPAKITALSPHRQAVVDSSPAEIVKPQTPSRKAYIEELVQLLLKIPGVNDANPRKRRRLFRCIQEHSDRRALLQAPPLDNPEDDLRLLIDKAIDLRALDHCLEEILKSLLETQLKTELTKIQTGLRSLHHRDKLQSVVRSVNFRKLRENLHLHFTREEIKDLCFELDIRYDDLPVTAGLNALCRELVEYLARRGRLEDCVSYCVEVRPRIDWDDVYI